ncbi:MAG: substrate-binding domain-containing protein [Desulfobacteraceae bacterium]|nr:substrate-binding domain-containing protein [Desulfobacteraceae bacterium]
MKYFYTCLIAVLFSVVLGLATAPQAHAEFVLSASCSSQIAEAFGREALEAFMTESGVKVKVHVSSSEVSIERLKNGFSNLAGSTVRITQEDRDAGLIEIPMCSDPMSVIVNAGCKVKNLSLDQVRQVFSAKITNWKELGGDDQPIILVVPAKNTGAYQNFKRLAMGPFEIKDDLVAGESFTTVTGVRHIPGAISFIANSVAIQHKELAVLNIDGLYPSDAGYSFHQIFSLVIKGDPDPMMKEVIKYLMSDKAKKRMTIRGMTPIIN